jgi:4-hydroxybutyrate CoA-transferase
VNEGRADYTPVFLSQVEDLLESKQLPIDVALIQLSPPDVHGFCCFGVGVEATLTAVRCAKFVVAQANARMRATPCIWRNYRQRWKHRHTSNAWH